MIRVMIVDDSAVARSTLREIFAQSEDIEVIGSAPDPMIAFPIMYDGWPDVIVSDIDMRRMDGIRFVRRVLEEKPTPIIALASTSDRGTQTAFNALYEGAFGLIAKPQIDVSHSLRARSAEILDLVKAAKVADVNNLLQKEILTLPYKSVLGGKVNMVNEDKIVAIGISNGGIQALHFLLSSLPEDCTGMVIVQHIPSEFTRKLVHQLNKACRVDVRIAQDGDVVKPGQVLIAPGGKHCRVNKQGENLIVEITPDDKTFGYCPSVDTLFKSVAKSAGKNAIGVIMTGFGSDGAAGLKTMADVGAETIAQDEASSVIFGMPREAIKLGAAKHIVSLYDLPDHIYQYCH